MTDTDSDAGSKMPLLEHLVELRRRLMWSVVAFVACFIIAFYFASPVFNFIAQPLVDLWAEEGQTGRFIYTAVQEKFVTDLKIGFFVGAFFAFPMIAIQVWLFVAPGLYKNEKRAFLPFLIATPVLFFVGSAFVYYFVLPPAWSFFADYQQAAEGTNAAIVLEPKVDQYLSFVVRLIFAFGISFELPVILTLLARIGIISTVGMRKNRRYAILIAFVVAAILTPPDPISQLGLAIPIILLYEISILCAQLVEKRRAAEAAKEAEDDPDDDSAGDDEVPT